MTDHAAIRQVHCGLGAFHKAHQVWYSQASEPDADRPQWPIASFTGRSPGAAEELSSQGCVYTLVERGSEGDSFHRMTQIVEAQPAASLARFAELVGAGETALITLTITEAAYFLTQGGSDDAGPVLDEQSPQVSADLKTLPAVLEALTGDTPPDAAAELPRLETVAARIVAGLAVRRARGGGPVAVVSCDNLAENGRAARAAVLGTALGADADLAEWIDAEVSFVSTSVDRITPRSTEEVTAAASEFLGRPDAAAVVTEPFSSWILSGDFPAGRPAWEKAGARFVPEIEPFERRKLWLLNGAHSLMAYAGQLRGHATVAEAVADPAIRAWVEEFWDEACRHLVREGGSVTAEDLELDEYRKALLERFANPRIEHRLEQIAADGSSKVPLRAVPVLDAERAAGREGAGAERIVSSWVEWLIRQHAEGGDLRDAAEARLQEALSGEDPAAALRDLVGAAGPQSERRTQPEPRPHHDPAP